MSAKVLFGMIGLFCFLWSDAVTAEEPAVMLKRVVLETVELSAGKSVIGEKWVVKGREQKGWTWYINVKIHGKILANGSATVVLQTSVREGATNVSKEFTAEFSASGKRTRPVQAAPVSPGQIPEDERKVLNVVKTVLTKYLRAKQTKISLDVSVFHTKHEYNIHVSPLPLVVGAFTTFIVDENYRIKKIAPGY